MTPEQAAQITLLLIEIHDRLRWIGLTMGVLTGFVIAWAPLTAFFRNR